MSYQPERDPILAVVRTLGSRIETLEEIQRMDDEREEFSQQTIREQARDLAEVQRERDRYQIDASRWRERVMELESQVLHPKYAAVISAAERVAKNASQRALRALRLALAELDREETL